MASPAPQLDRDEQLNEILLSYVESIETGQVLDRRDLLSRYPEFATELSEFFDSRDQVERLTAPLRDAVRSGSRMKDGGNDSGSSFIRDASSLDKPLGRLGDFRLLREIGRGGMGVVYEAVQISLDRPVALKVLPFAAALDPKQLQRFKHEAQASAHLHHNHIVPVYAVGCERGVHYYAMQLINGQSLAALIAELRQQARLPTGNERTSFGRGGLNRPLTPQPASPEAPAAELSTKPIALLSTARSNRHRDFYRQAADLAMRAAQALDHAHSFGVVHRDIKPANLLVAADGNLWITDFGLALFQSDMGLTMTGEILGTLRYMSPEQALGKRGMVDHRTDIYSLGVTLYELLTSQPAFDGTDRQELLHQITLLDPLPPRRIDKRIPVELETIVLKAIAKSSAERYASAQEMADDLQRFLDDKPVLARRPSLLDKANKWAKRHRSLVASAAILFVIVTAGSIAFNVRLAQEEAKTKEAYENEQREANEAKEQRDRAERNLLRAETSFLQARNAVEFLTEMAEKLPDTPLVQGVRRRMMEEAHHYYKTFIDQHQDDPQLKRELAESYDRISKLLVELGNKPEAIVAGVKAHQFTEQLLRAYPSEEYQRRLVLSESHLYDLQGCKQLGWLSYKPVWEDLRLSDVQKKQIAELSELLKKQRQYLIELPPLTPEDRGRELDKLAQENKKRLGQILSPEQTTRLKQISVQMRGSRVFNDPEIVEALALTSEQRERIVEILRDSWTGPGGPGSRRKPDEGRKRTTEKILLILTNDQRAKWEQLVGPPLKEEIRR